MPGLEDLYREIILDHYRSPRNRGELESPPAVRVEGFNPLCGDEIVVTIDAEDGVLADISEADDWLMEHPVPAILMAASTPSSASMVTTISSPHSGLNPSTRTAGGDSSSPRFRGER